LRTQDDLKAAAAAHALDWVKPGMVVGLGTGTTAEFFIEGLAKRVSEGLNIRVVATSKASATLARDLGMVVIGDVDAEIDLAVDGADEIDPNRRLIKGRGGAMAREKLVATAARRFVVIADMSKLVLRLGEGPLPVEVLPFMWQTTRDRLADLGATCKVRGGDADPFTSDNGNMILDLMFPVPFGDPSDVARRLKLTIGVVDHGIFDDPADTCIIAGESGIEIMGEPTG